MLFSFTLNIVQTKLKHKHENRRIDFDAFDLQELKKNVADLLYFGIFYSLILPDNFDIYLSFVVTCGNHLKYIADTAQHLQQKCAFYHFNLIHI